MRSPSRHLPHVRAQTAVATAGAASAPTSARCGGRCVRRNISRRERSRCRQRQRIRANAWPELDSRARPLRVTHPGVERTSGQRIPMSTPPEPSPPRYVPALSVPRTRSRPKASSRPRMTTNATCFGSTCARARGRWFAWSSTTVGRSWSASEPTPTRPVFASATALRAGGHHRGSRM